MRKALCVGIDSYEKINNLYVSILPIKHSKESK